MPGIGSLNHNANRFYQLPDQQQTTVDAGVSLIECRLTKPFDNTQKIFGLWDVATRMKMMEGSFGVRYQTHWFQDSQSYVEFRPQRGNGICVGFVPDDPVWHNRIILVDLLEGAQVDIARVHTQQGAISQQIALAQIRCVRDYIKEYAVEVAGQVVFTAKKRSLADEYVIKECAGKDAKVRWTLTQEIMALYREYRGAWMSCPEFQSTHRKRIEQTILSTTQTVTASKAASVVEELLSLPAEEQAKIRAFFTGGTVDPAATAQAEAQPAADGKGEVPLEKMHINSLRQIAKEYGINTKDMAKEDVVAAIKKSVNESAATAPSNPVPPPEMATDYSQFNDTEELEAQ
jgi:hypothetical protein